MKKRLFISSITVHNRDLSYKKVSEILHNYAEYIKLRVGYPIENQNISIIFLIMELTNDQAGAFSGAIGQLPSVKVSINPIKM